MTLVSVIIPYFNKQKYISKTIYSVLNQSFKNIEILIVFDDSKKTDLKILKNLAKKDKRIKIIVNKNNLGAAKSRNKAIKLSKGEFIAFIDSDDIWKKDKLKFQINYMKKNNILFSHTSYKIINEYGKIIGKFKVKKNTNYKELLKSCDIGLSTVVSKKKIFSKHKFPNQKTKEDFALWLKLAKKNVQLVGLNKYSTLWRRAPNSLSSSIFQRIRDAYRVYSYEEKKGFFVSVYYVLILSINSLIKKNRIFNL